MEGTATFAMIGKQQQCFICFGKPWEKTVR